MASIPSVVKDTKSFSENKGGSGVGSGYGVRRQIRNNRGAVGEGADERSLREGHAEAQRAFPFPCPLEAAGACQGNLIPLPPPAQTGCFCQPRRCLGLSAAEPPPPADLNTHLGSFLLFEASKRGENSLLCVFPKWEASLGTPLTT